MNHLDLIEDYISSEKQYLADCLLSQKAAYFPPPNAANLSLDKIGYTSDLISKIAREQKAATLMNNVLKNQRQALYEAANPCSRLNRILEKERNAIYEAANSHLVGTAQARAALDFELIPRAAYPYVSNRRKASAPQPAKRSRTYEKPSSYNDDSNIFIFEPKSKLEKPLSVDHSRLKRIAEHEKRLAELKENTHPIMEIRQVVFLVMPDIDANQEREALAKAIITSIKHGYLKLEWVQDKESFIHKPFHQQILASIHVNDFTHCANAGWLGDTALVMALQWHSYLRKPQSALPVQDEKKLPLLEQRISVIRKVLKDLGYDDPSAFEPSSKTKTLAVLYELCLSEDKSLFRTIAHPKVSGSFRTEVWAQAKKILFKEKQKDTTVG
jgi:hypothetical protein